MKRLLAAREKDTPKYAEDGIKLVNMQSNQTGTLRFVIHNVKDINKDCTFTLASVFERDLTMFYGNE